MKELDAFKKLLSGMMAGKVPVQTLWATCTAVNGDTMTAKELVHELELFDVLLGLDIVRIPKVGAKCLIGIIGNKPTDVFMIWCNEVEEIRLKGEDYTLLKGAETMAELQKTQAVVNALINVIAGTPVPEPGNGAASALQLALKGATAGLPKAEYKDELQNKKVKHG